MTCSARLTGQGRVPSSKCEMALTLTPILPANCVTDQPADSRRERNSRRTFRGSSLRPVPPQAAQSWPKRFGFTSFFPRGVQRRTR